MDYSLKWWQWAIMALLILSGAVPAVLSGGPIAAIYGQLAGVVTASVAVVYGVVLAGRALTQSGSSTSAE